MLTRRVAGIRILRRTPPGSIALAGWFHLTRSRLGVNQSFDFCDGFGGEALLFEKLEENREFVESALALVDYHAFRINYILIVVKDDDATGFGTGGGVLGVEFRTIDVDVPAVDGSEIEVGFVAEVPANGVHETSHLHVRNPVGRTEAGGMSSEFF